MDIVEVIAKCSLANIIDSSPKGGLLCGFYNDISIPVKFMAKSFKSSTYKTYLNLPVLDSSQSHFG